MQPTHSSDSRASRLALSIAFGATGIATVFPGTVLPALLHQWSLRDSQAGLLFFLLWSASSLGALLARGAPERAMLAGSALLALVCTALPYTQNSIAALLLFALFGLSLGIIMTSISILRTLRSDAPGREMNRMNLYWAAGACLCPLLFGRLLKGHPIAPALFALALAAAALAVWVAVAELPQAGRIHPAQSSRNAVAKLRLPFAYAVATALITGVESTTGGWIATHVQRLHHSAPAATLAVFCFWFGLLGGRALVSAGVFSRWQDSTLVRAGALMTCLAVFALLIGGSNAIMLPAVFLVGFCGGPIYPLLVGIAVARYRGNVIFFMGGVGAAILPWLTGVASSRTGSLSAAFFVPAIAATLMAITAWPAMQNIHSEIGAEAPATEAL